MHQERGFFAQAIKPDKKYILGNANICRDIMMLCDRYTRSEY